MTKRYRKILTCMISFIMLFSLLAAYPTMAISARAASDPGSINNKKACWISFLDIEVLLQDKNEKDFRDKVSAMYDNVIQYGMNTVIVHVRALGDAMYPSDYYPWAEYFTTDRRDPGYDPLQIMLDLAHQKTFSLRHGSTLTASPVTANRRSASRQPHIMNSFVLSPSNIRLPAVRPVWSSIPQNRRHRI